MNPELKTGFASNGEDGLRIVLNCDTVGDAIRRERKAKKWTLKTLSEHSDLSISFLSDLERGQVTPSLGTLEKLATAFQKTITIDVPFEYMETEIEFYDDLYRSTWNW